MRQSDQKSLKNGVEKQTTFNRIWTPKRGQVDPKINRTSKKSKNQNSEIMEMQKMQKVQKPSKSDAPDLERTPNVGKLVSKSDKKSSGH